MPHATATRTAPPLTQVGHIALLAGIAMFVLVAAVLAVRRFVAPAGQSLQPVSLVMLIATCAASAMLVRVWWVQAFRNVARPQRWALWLLPTAGLLLLGLAVSAPRVSLSALLIAWLIILVEEGLMFWRGRRWLLPARMSPGTNAISHAPLSNESAVPADADVSLAELPATTTQAIQRHCLADGGETISGMLRAGFAPGQRAATLHVAFCPPLAAVPTVAAEQSDGPEAEIKVTQALPHGARFDVRLKRTPTEAVTVVLEFHAATEDERGLRGED